MENKCCCEYCKEQEIKILKKEIKEYIKLIKANLNLGLIDSYLYDFPDLAEKYTKILYEKVKKLNKLDNEIND